MEYAGFGKKPPSRMPWFLMAITSTASVVILLAVLMVVRTSQSPSSSTVLDTTIPLGNPQPPTLVHFTDAREYQSFDNDADILWKKLRPSSKGFARWTDPSGETQGFGVSMFHQLHCLENIRSALQGFLNPNSTAEMDSAVMADGRSHLAVHMGHCLDYIRQGIMCCVDGTIEPLIIDSQGQQLADYRVPHTCGDSHRLWQVAAPIE